MSVVERGDEVVVPACSILPESHPGHQVAPSERPESPLREDQVAVPPRPFTALALEILGERGWTQGEYEDPASGAVCFVGAFRLAVVGSAVRLLSLGAERVRVEACRELKGLAVELTRDVHELHEDEGCPCVVCEATRSSWGEAILSVLVEENDAGDQRFLDRVERYAWGL